MVKALAVDLGGSHAACALVEGARGGGAAGNGARSDGASVVEGARVLAVREVALDAVNGLGPALPEIADALRGAAREAGVALADCAGLAFGFCGLVDAGASRVLSTNAKYDDATRLDLAGWSREALGLPLRLENDARLALLGERHAGAARGCDDVVMMTLGTGIGGVAMIGGRLLRGRHQQAGVLGGHLAANAFGRACTCGAVGCAEAEASGWALPELARGWPGFTGSALAAAEPLDFERLFACADAGDAVAVAVRDHCLRVWATAAVSMIHAWDPERLVVGGGVMARADLVLPAIAAHVRAHAWTPWGKVDVRAAELGRRAALLGAIPLLEAA